jgi:peroxiredoxin
MKKTALAFTVLLTFFIFSSQLFPGEKDILRQARKLSKQKEYAKALELIDKGLKEHRDSEKLLLAKSGILINLNRLDDALKAAKKRVEVAKRKSPWHCIAVASIYMKMKNTGSAFQWLEKAVDRGWLNYSALEDEEGFEPVLKDKRFPALVAKIKDRIGIGKPAKDFTVTLVGGESFTLSKQKGSVILVDFWATWCPPCVKGIPYLKKYYKEHKEKNFEIIGISLDDSKQKVLDYIAKEKLEWKTACSEKAWFSDTARQYNVNLIPSYWLIDRKGILRDFGYHLRDKETMKKAIEKLVSE